jgi:hypothetical protein
MMSQKISSRCSEIPASAMSLAMLSDEAYPNEHNTYPNFTRFTKKDVDSNRRDVISEATSYEQS